jgi:hypothetical protein
VKLTQIEGLSDRGPALLSEREALGCYIYWLGTVTVCGQVDGVRSVSTVGLSSAHTGYLCVLCGSENKQRLFHCTALTGWFL